MKTKHGGFSGGSEGFFGDSSGNYPQVYDRARIPRLYQVRIPSKFYGELNPPGSDGEINPRVYIFMIGR